MARVRHQLPAWSREKRVKVAVAGTMGVLLLSYIIGGGGYVLGMKIGVIDRSRNLKMEVFERVIEDPKIVAAVQKSSQARTCVNTVLGLQIQYQHPLTSMTDTGENACLQWVLPNVDGSQARIVVTQRKQPQSQVLDEILVGMDQILTDSVNMAGMSGTMVTGLKETKAYEAYVLEFEPNTTWLVELMPANDATRPSFNYMVSHMVMVE